MKRTVILMAFGLLVLNVPAWSVTHHVDAVGGADFDSIGEAFAVAVDGDSIVVAPGNYTGANNRDIDWGDRNLVLTKAPDRQNPVIDCGGMGRFLLIESAMVDTTSVIRGFTVMNGLSGSGGGAIKVASMASLIIELCDFVSNQGFDGAVQVITSDAKIRSCLFRSNTGDYGGGLSLSGGNAVARDCFFLDNTATVEGGAIRVTGNASPYPIIRNCTIVRNGSPAGGGVGISYGGQPTIDRCVIALSTEGAAAVADGTEFTEIVHSIIYANAGGDSLPANHHDNLFRDPLFCDPGSDNFAVCEDSPALPGFNPWGVEIGFTSFGCPPCDTPVVESGWGSIKALYR